MWEEIVFYDHPSGRDELLLRMRSYSSSILTLPEKISVKGHGGSPNSLALVPVGNKGTGLIAIAKMSSDLGRDFMD